MSLTVDLWRRARINYSDQPATPAAPVASNITATGVTMTWLPINGADWYRLEISPAGAGTWVLNHHGGALSKVVTGLTANTSYDFRLAAFAGGQFGAQSEWSATTNMTTLVSSSPPATPSAPTASNISETTATLTVAAVATATSYGWQRSATSGTTGFATIAGTGLSINDSGLTTSTPYWYRVRASNADGDSAYSTATAITTADPPVTVPGKPAKLILAGQTPTSNTLTITPVSGATSYQVQRSTTAPGAAPWSNVYIGPNLSVDDPGRTPLTTYYYRHSASNTAGESPQSDTLTVTNPSTNPDVQPFSALQLRNMSGLAIHAANNPWIEYDNEDEVIALALRLGVTWVRGLATPGNAVSDRYAAAIRAAGLKWCMGVVGTANGPTTTTAANKVRDIANHPDYSAVCLALEGLNEPNDGNHQPAIYGTDWADWAVDIQKTIFETAHDEFPAFAARIEFCGAALHQLRVNESNGAHYQMIVDRGIKNWTTEAGLHAYPNGLRPLNGMDQRFAYIRNAYGSTYPIRMTEFGYTTTATAPTTGSPGNRTTKRALGIYGPRAYLQLCAGLGIPMSWYEALDDVDSTGDDIQSHYGMVNTPSLNTSTWTDKPVVASIGSLLNAIKDPPGTAAYTPVRVIASVTSGTQDVTHFVTATKAQSNAGTATVWVFRDVSVAKAVTDLTVLPVNVTVVDRVGSRTFQIDGAVTKVDLR